MNKIKNIIIINMLMLLIISCLSCNSYYSNLYGPDEEYGVDPLTIISSEYEHCFTSDIVSDLEKQVKKHTKKPISIYIDGEKNINTGGILTNSCAGLFIMDVFPRTSNKNRRRYIPLLKFEDRIEINFKETKYSDNKTNKRITKIINEFSTNYGELFDEKDLEEIVRQFEKKSEITISGRDSVFESCFTDDMLKYMENQVNEHIKCPYILATITVYRTYELNLPLVDSCVGLFFLEVISCQNITYFIPILKFNERIEMNFKKKSFFRNKKNREINKTIIEFSTNYGHKFDEKVLEEIIRRFEIGTITRQADKRVTPLI